MLKNTIVIISGPSGAGKGTIIKELLGTPEFNFTLCTKTTTRKIRSDECEGKDIITISKTAFVAGIANKEWLFYSEYNNHYYGLSRHDFQTLQQQNKNIIFEAPVSSMFAFYNNIDKADVGKVISIYLLPRNIAELQKRITSRGGCKKTDVDYRLGRAVNNLVFKNFYDYEIINANGYFAETIRTIKNIINENCQENEASKEKLVTEIFADIMESIPSINAESKEQLPKLAVPTMS